MANPDPDKCARAIEGAMDKYVKQRARNTIALSAERDPACAGYARIPGPDACEFCVTMGAANDFYHTKDSAGGGSGHGTADDHYHPYCNCQVCLVFRKGGKPGGDLIARDPETGEVVPYDPADILRRYDEAGHPTFAKNRAREAGRRPGSRPGTGGKVDRSLEDQAVEFVKGQEKLASKYERRDELAKNLESTRRKMSRTKNRDEHYALRDEWELLKKEYDKVNGYLGYMEERNASLMRKAIGTRRELGAEAGKTASDYFDLQCTAVVERLVEDAMQYVPRDWLETMRSAGVRVKTMRESREKRSHFSIGENTLYIKRSSDKLTVVHELMHAMDRHSKAFFDESRMFFERRTQGKPLERLRDITGNRRYYKDEMAYNVGGGAVNPYAFKEYRNSATGDLYAFEVSSMGVEYLYRCPWKFVKDLDHLKFVLHQVCEV